MHIYMKLMLWRTSVSGMCKLYAFPYILSRVLEKYTLYDFFMSPWRLETNWYPGVKDAFWFMPQVFLLLFTFLIAHYISDLYSVEVIWTNILELAQKYVSIVLGVL